MPVRVAWAAIGLLINLAGNEGIAEKFLRPIKLDRAVNRHMQTVLEYRETPLLASYYLIGGTNENYKTEGTPIGRPGRQELLYLFSRETPRRSFYKGFVWEDDDPRRGMITQSGFECLIARLVVRAFVFSAEPGGLEPYSQGRCRPDIFDLRHDRQQTPAVSDLRGTSRFDIHDGKPRSPNGNSIFPINFVAFDCGLRGIYGCFRGGFGVVHADAHVSKLAQEHPQLKQSNHTQDQRGPDGGPFRSPPIWRRFGEGVGIGLLGVFGALWCIDHLDDRWHRLSTALICGFFALVVGGLGWFLTSMFPATWGWWL